MKDSRERGAAVVEFAIIVPLLLMLILGLVEYGFRYQRAAVLNNASFIASRQLSIHKTPSEARAAAVAAGMPDSAIFEATFDPGPASSCTSVSNVTVKITSVENSPTGAFFKKTFTINAKGVARCDG